MKINITLVLLFFWGLSMSAQQDTCVKSIVLDLAMITADKVKAYRDYEYVMVDFEIADDKFFILQRETKSIKTIAFW